MLDIKFIRDNPDIVKDAISKKQLTFDLDQFLKLDEQRRELIEQKEKLLAERNQLTIEESKSLGAQFKKNIAEIEPELARVESEYQELLLLIPQIPSSDSPVGGESANEVIREVGEKPQFPFEMKDHIKLGADLDLIDFEAGRKVAGFRGYFLKNEAVLLQYGLIQLALELMRNKGFTLMASPTVIREFALTGSGHFPFGKSEVYRVGNATRLENDNEKESHFLAGTAEPSLLGYFANTVLQGEQLPAKVCGVSTCYRSEAGSYGKDTKGLYRVHEFIKVEQVVVCEATDKSQSQHFNEMLAISEELLSSLKLPYRIVNISTGDMGAGKVYMNDIETWMPGRNSYGETHSNSALGDWQARRLGIKYGQQDKKTFAYTLNNTVIASPRILISILENNQLEDGSVKVPEVLQKFVGGEVIRRK